MRFTLIVRKVHFPHKCIRRHVFVLIGSFYAQVVFANVISRQLASKCVLFQRVSKHSFQLSGNVCFPTQSTTGQWVVKIGRLLWTLDILALRIQSLRSIIETNFLKSSISRLNQKNTFNRIEKENMLLIIICIEHDGLSFQGFCPLC